MNFYGVTARGWNLRPEVIPVHRHIGGIALSRSFGNSTFGVQEVLEACLASSLFESFVVSDTRFALDCLCQALDAVDSGRRCSEGNHECLPAYHAASPVSATTDRLNSQSSFSKAVPLPALKTGVIRLPGRYRMVAAVLR
ncbi:hypothetical protein D9M70_616860 [compost metagenome]